MKKSRIFFWIGILMILFAIIFVGYALQHPESSMNVPIVGTTGLYRIYMIVAIGSLILARIMKLKNK
jgi:hypothetical protein